LRCTGKGCKRHVLRRTVRAHRGTIFKRPLKVRKGKYDRFKKVTLEVTVEYPGAVGQFTRWRVRKGSRNTHNRKNLCIYPGGRKTKCRQ
jgi:hypothetical protein